MAVHRSSGSRRTGYQPPLTAEAVLNVIKNRSCEPKLREFLGASQQTRPAAAAGEVCVKLFEKELTPRDEGKLNRLAVPKNHALRCFPAVLEAAGEELILEFRDPKGGGEWRFRYCYWGSSQSYVFTKGWSKFVKEKGLKAKDVVVFRRYEEQDDDGIRRRYCEIDVERRGRGSEEEEEAVWEMMAEEQAKVVRLFGVCINS